MIKRIALVVAVFFTTAVFCGVAAEKVYAKEYKMAYVDLGRVFDEYKKTKDSEKLLEEKGKAKDAERKKLVDELKNLKDEQALLSEKGKAEKQTAIDNKIRMLQEFDMKARNELMKERNDKLGLIMKDIESVVSEYAKEAGYDLVLNSRTLLYGKEEYDMTTEVLKRLNK